MKRKLKVIAAILLVLIMFISAMPMQLAAEAMTPPTTRYATPDGYNDHDYQKMVAFFEQTDENGVRNGEKLSEDYDPTDPGTWWEADGSEIGVEWTVDDDDVPFPVSWTVKMKKKQKETQDILSYHSQAAGCSDKARAKASGGRQPIEECGRTGL